MIDDEITTDVAAVFASSEYEFVDSWKLDLALRYDREERETENLLPTDA